MKSSARVQAFLMFMGNFRAAAFVCEKYSRTDQAAQNKRSRNGRFRHGRRAGQIYLVSTNRGTSRHATRIPVEERARGNRIWSAHRCRSPQGKEKLIGEVDRFVVRKTHGKIDRKSVV